MVPNYKQLNIRVPAEVKKGLKLEALERGVPLEKVVLEVLQDYLKGREKHG